MTQLGQDDVDLSTHSSATDPYIVTPSPISRRYTEPKSIALLKKLRLAKTDQGAIYTLLIITCTCFALAIYLYYNIFNPPEGVEAEDMYQRVQNIKAGRNI